MKKSFLAVFAVTVCIVVSAQEKLPKTKPAATYAAGKKYPSLLWEITGNGMKKPSYLFGTMHVSNKLVFHLGDSFYNALKSVQIVALETNPEFWQDQYSKSLIQNAGSINPFAESNFTKNVSIADFAIKDYTDVVKASLTLEPAMINSFLYRTYGGLNADYEEDTYLDMHIFQAGKKLKKQLSGLENFSESEKLIMEAYRDMQKDKDKKLRSYDQDMNDPKLIEKAYRKGDLDLLDSLEVLNVTSDAFQEKFLYKRNEIQAKSIDTILKKNLSLFAAVGAAHLPGDRGVIQMLREMGYKLRPVKMDQRNSVHKEAIEKIHYPVIFATQYAADSFYQVNIPGEKFYKYASWSALDASQYADMINGAYYTVSRLKTNALFLGQTEDNVSRSIDSMLYENIPGKMQVKKPILKNGYKGWDITSRTRRGDVQRYNVFTTPFEVIIFKMSGNGDFVTSTNDADAFFNSIKFKTTERVDLQSYTPPAGGFSVLFPHQPSVLKFMGRLEYAATDKKGNDYLVMQANVQNFSFFEEDSFELNLMDESYGWSDFVKEAVRKKFSTVNGYPSLETEYLHKDGSRSSVKYIIRGPLYYLVAAHYTGNDDKAKKFLRSFSIEPVIYPEIKLRTDTSMHYTVRSPLFTDSLLAIQRDSLMNIYRDMQQDDDESGSDLADKMRMSVISNDTLGARIIITYIQPKPYDYLKDSTRFWRFNMFNEDGIDDSSYVYSGEKIYRLNNGTRVREIQVSDTGSSRRMLVKWFNKEGHVFVLTALTDTVNKPGAFITSFFESFTPADSLHSNGIFERKTGKFFQDFFSNDSLIAKTAARFLYQIKFDSLDLPDLRSVAEKLNWDTKNYLETKKFIIRQVARWNDPKNVPFLRSLYKKAGDTVELQNVILTALLEMETRESFKAFKDLILEEPPIIDDDPYSSSAPPVIFSTGRNYPDYSRSHEDYDPWSPLYDSLSLTKTLFPEILQLLNIDDYKQQVMRLASQMVAEGFLKGSDYESYFGKFYLEAKRKLKKQVAADEKEKMETITRQGEDFTTVTTYSVANRQNTDLDEYAQLLIPFYDKNSGVADFFKTLMKTTNESLLYETLILLLKNNKPVNDSLYLHFARLDAYRNQLFHELNEMNKKEKFPKEYSSPEQIARSVAFRYYSEKPDSIVYLDKITVSDKDGTGDVYFFKYRKQKHDNFWNIAMAGRLPANIDSVDLWDYSFIETSSRKLDNEKPVKKQLEIMLHEKQVMSRPGGSSFYQAREYKQYRSDYDR
jgi:uncharacterized protein YbaP (TraB family)